MAEMIQHADPGDECDALARLAARFGVSEEQARTMQPYVLGWAHAAERIVRQLVGRD